MVMLASLGKLPSFKIFGTDYNTKDGTCIRDFIHVNDLANAHILALKKLEKENKSNTYNLGSGLGYSVKEVVLKAQKITGVNFNVMEEKRREGDIVISLAGIKKAKRELGWKPQLNNLEEILKTDWAWYQSHPNGYNS
jgi:UDP-glucose 4-epimerase